MPQSLGLGPTNTLRLNSLTSLVFKIIFNPQPPVMQIGKLGYLLKYGLATFKKHSSKALWEVAAMS